MTYNESDSILSHSRLSTLKERFLTSFTLKMALVTALTAGLISDGFAAPVRIGNEAALDLPSSALHRLFVGNAPDDGSVQAFNPPVFKWLYYDNPWTMGYPNAIVRTFRFQLSTNTSFANPYWNIVCSNNFYNCLPPITNANGTAWAGTNYWRVIYLNSNATVTVATSVVHHFTLAPTATTWNRAMLADKNYLLSIGTNHPHMFFSLSNRDAMSTFLRTNTAMGWSWAANYNLAFQTITNRWWNNDSFTNVEPANVIEQIANVALIYQMTTNTVLRAANPGQMASRIASRFIQKDYDRIDQNRISGAAKFLPLLYDWTYHDMTPLQRSNVLWTLEKFAQFFVYEDWWYAGTPPSTNRTYTNSLQIQYHSAAKCGSSHARVDCGLGLFMTMGGMGESALLRELQGYFLNYSIAQVDPFNGDEGRAYAEQSFRALHNFSGHLLASTVFREANLTNNPWFPKYSRMFAHLQPLNYAEVQSQFGDFGLALRGGLPDTQLYNYKYYDLAIMLQNGPLLRQHRRNYTRRAGTAEFIPYYGEAFVPFYYPTVPNEKDWDDTSYVDAADGWCMSSTYPANNWNSFTNGVGFVFTARPAGNRNEHGTWHDGAIQLWAYGAQISCGGIGNYYKHPMLYPGLFVDGIGTMTPNGQNPTEDWYSRLIAFTNNSDFTYVAAELGRAYNRSNFAAGGGLGNITGSHYNQATNRRPYVASVQRHVVFPHKKYLVLYDTFTTTRPAQFQWKWNIMEPTASVNASACSFSYTTTNFHNRSNVSVYVKHLVDPARMSLLNLVGTNYAVINPFTGENYTSATSIINGPRWNSTVWVSNRTPTTNWHFMSVIYPVKWGEIAPTITRIDDFTVRVTRGSDNDLIQFEASGTNVVVNLDLNGSSQRLARPAGVLLRPGTSSN